jgi:hypothetical protein
MEKKIVEELIQICKAMNRMALQILCEFNKEF